MAGLKYNIDKLLNELSKSDYDKAIHELPNLLDRSVSQFNRMRKVGFEDSYSIKTDQLIVIAKYLNCSLDELVNSQTEKKKSKSKKVA